VFAHLAPPPLSRTDGPGRAEPLDATAPRGACSTGREGGMSEPAGSTAVGHGRVPEPADPYLSHWNANAEQRRWVLPTDGRAVTIGRSSATDICIGWDSKVSRVHATMERIGGQWTVEDDGLSRNGTFVNDTRLTSRVRLRDRDKITLGGTVLTFCCPPQTTSQQTQIGDATPARSRLTGPQRSVLLALCRPYKAGRPYATPATNQQIADELFLSLDAVKTHLRMLFHKFGIEDLPQNQKRARLVEMALQFGVIAESEL
jgi:FHA domain/Bacterial regulatory proteins, luxR family